MIEDTHHSSQDHFLKLYRPCHSSLSRFVGNMVWDVEDARDLMSDTVMIAWQSFHQLKDEKAFLAYLFTIAHRQVKKYRRRKSLFGFIAIHEEMEVIDQASSPDILADAGIVKEMLKYLKHKERESFVLFEVSGLSIKEIQEIQGDSLSAVKSRLVRAREKLQRILNDNPSGKRSGLEIKSGVKEWFDQKEQEKEIVEEANIIVLRHAASGK